MTSVHPDSATKGATRGAPKEPPAAGLSWVGGIDENGLGPRLGPLVVTGALARVRGDGARIATKKPRARFRPRLGDSKRLVAFGDSALGEAWARAVLARQGLSPRSPAEALAYLSIDGPGELKERCPTTHEAQCWGVEDEAFCATDELIRKVERDLAALDALGVDLRGVSVALVCTERLNDAVARGRSRFDVDLHTMERLGLRLRAACEGDLHLTCGKVGGFDFYGERFGPLAQHLHTTLMEGRARSEYAVAGLGRVAFVRDADEGHLLVCLASLVGKWARDLVMERIVRYHRRQDPALPAASGYHDPVTSRFIAATALHRKAALLPEACFERNRLGDGDGVSGASARKLPKARKRTPVPEQARLPTV